MVEITPAEWARHVRGVRFRRRLFGYRPADVHEHLEHVSGWFLLSGLDDLLDERMRALTDQAERRRAEAAAEAARVVADARQEAESIERTAQDNARTILEQARREAELERRGRTRVGRPVGARSNGH